MEFTLRKWNDWFDCTNVFVYLFKQTISWKSIISIFCLITMIQTLGPNFLQKLWVKNFFFKINTEFETRLKQCISVPDFSQFGELYFWGPNLPKKHFRIAYLDKFMYSENDLFYVKITIIWLVQMFSVVFVFSKYKFFSVLTKL